MVQSADRGASSGRNSGDRGRRRSAPSALTALALLVAIAVALGRPPTADAAPCTATFVGDIDSNWFTVIDPPGPDNTNTNWSGDQDPPNDNADVACIPAGLTAVVGGSSQGAGALIAELQVAAGAELTIQATDSPTNNQLGRIHAEKAAINDGTIRLRTVAGAGDASLHVDESLQPDTRTLDNDGTLITENVAGTGDVTLQGSIDNDGSVLANHPDTIYENAGHDQTITNAGLFQIAGGSVFRMGPNSLYEFHQVSGSLTGGGELRLDRGTDTFRMSGGAVAAEITLDAGTLAFQPSAAGTAGAITLRKGGVPGTTPEGPIPAGWVVTLLADGVVGAGSLISDDDWTNNGEIVVEQSGGTTSAAAIKAVDGSAATTETFTNNGTVEIDQTGGTADFHFRGDIVNGSGGTMLLDHDTVSHRPLEDGGRAQTFTNAGDVTLPAGARLDNRLAAGYTQTGGSTTVNGTLETTIGPVDIQGGSLTGSGTVDGDLASSGTVGPGSSPGVLSVDGDYTQEPGGRLLAEIRGTAPGSGHDRLAVSGTAALGGNGSLSLLYPGGFAPAPGNAFTVLTASSIQGRFGTVSGRDAPGRTALDPSYSATALTLNATAEPACADELDNDGDGKTDFPADPGCSSAADGNEADLPQPPGPPAVDPDCQRAKTQLRKASKAVSKAKRKAKRAKRKAEKRGTKQTKRKAKRAKKKLKRAKQKRQRKRAKKRQAC